MERNVNELENKNDNDDTASDGEEREVCFKISIKIFMYRSQRQFIILISYDTPQPLTHQQSDKLTKLKSSSISSSLLVEDHLMLKYDRLIDISQLGRGHYGEVLNAFLMDCDIPEANFKEIQVKEEMDEIVTQKKYKVLAKSLSAKHTEQSYVIEFQRQIELFRSINSNHVVKLLALSFDSDHHYLILEHGQDLRSFLSLTNHDAATITLLCSHITRGLKHITKLNLTHR